MKYRVLKLRFQTAVHFGTGGLTTTGYTVMADTLFSALCVEAVRDGRSITAFIERVREGHIRISDAMPFIGERLYIPRPLLEINVDREGDSSAKKALKKLPYIPAERLGDYLAGKMDAAEEATLFHQGLGEEHFREKASISDVEQTRPYGMNTFRFKEGSGLYILLGYDCEEDYLEFSEMIELLSYAGIGGKISAGYGKFSVISTACPETVTERMKEAPWHTFMTLSVSLPLEEELEDVAAKAQYHLIKRSGWLSPGTEAVRKRTDIYMFEAGAICESRYKGDLYDLSEEDAHPVFRYGYPMFMGVI